MKIVDNQSYAMFFLPRNQKWWIEYIEKNPSETFGFKKAKVIFLENVYYPEKLKLRIPEKLTNISPCGASCKECPSMTECSCCPATILYKKSNQGKNRRKLNLKLTN
ncbi:MAG: hypothetical protein ACFE75_02835 [Candidatus Hodarchaeota archaeon]